MLEGSKSAPGASFMGAPGESSSISSPSDKIEIPNLDSQKWPSPWFGDFKSPI